MEYKTCESNTFVIYIAGAEHLIKDECKYFCRIGFCVSIKPADYIYTGGSETGFEITIINYARFPSTYENIKEKVLVLAESLINKAYQRSCSIVSSKESIWVYRNEEA